VFLFISTVIAQTEKMGEIFLIFSVN